VPRGDNTQTIRATLGLRQLLFEGEIRPGERLAELALVDLIGVSRTPVRLALTMLEHEGLVEALPGGGFSAREFTLAEIDDGIELRGVLEGTAARLAAERLERPEELDGLRETVAEIDRAIRDDVPAAMPAYAELNELFHAGLVAASKSTPLARAIDRVMALPFASPAALLASMWDLPAWAELLLVAQHQHRSLVDAIAARQGTRAEQIAREHARLSRENLDLVLERRDLRERVPGATLLAVGTSHVDG
jgi:GntR family transcriptional regulator, vanillate catabolism transcriptional regulator